MNLPDASETGFGLVVFLGTNLPAPNGSQPRRSEAVGCLAQLDYTNWIRQLATLLSPADNAAIPPTHEFRGFGMASEPLQRQIYRLLDEEAIQVRLGRTF